MSAPLILSFHAAYGCRDRGACCTAGWPIPIEAPRLPAMEQAIADGRLRAPSGATTMLLRSIDAHAETPALAALSQDGCVFYRPAGAGRCEIHRVLGHGSLPLACRQFPRVSVHDPRGSSITLSHYCPTAADLLEQTGPVAIVTDERRFPSGAEYVGLEARTELPPLLAPAMLMDWDSWWLWEREAVAAIDTAATPELALARLRGAVEHTRGWRPVDGPLAGRIDEAFAHARRSPGTARQPASGDVLIERVRRAVPEDLRPWAIGPGAATALSPDAHRRFIAAHAFANWTAHLGGGLRSWLRSVEAAHALVARGLGPGDADLLLRHLADPRTLSDGWSEAEKE